VPEVFNAADWLVARQVRAGNGSRVAVRGSRGSLTYAELDALMRRVATSLDRFTVRPEERVVMVMADDLELYGTILGAMWLGAVPVPVSTMLTGPELGALLADSRARVVYASAEFAPAVATAVAAAPEVTLVIWDDPETPRKVDLSEPDRLVDQDSFVATFPDPPDGPRSYDPRRRGPAAAAPYPTWADSPALWLYTSGTTGVPKAAMHRHGSIRAVAETYARGVLGIGPDDVCLSVPKLFFAYGLGNSLFFPLSVGACVLLERGRPTPASIAERARTGAPTLFFGVPTFYAAVLGAGIDQGAFGSVRQGVSAGEPLPPVIYQRFRDRFGVEILDGIGSTEALHIFASNRPGAVHPGSSGTPVPGYEVELREEGGGVIDKPGVPGGLFVRGPSLASGYWCRAETTQAVFQGEWLRTGDTYVRNDDGTMSCLGRSDDMIKAGGIWVSPAEVEARLLEHPAVAEAAVVAVPDADGLDKPVALVVFAPGAGATEAELVEFCRQSLAGYKRPRRVIEVDELPKTATGKLRRHLVRERLRGAP
jgi:benzoate-CoA ligase family protein